MTQDHFAQQLHDRATRGESLSPTELTQLEEWYAQQDRKEGAALRKQYPPQYLTTLQAQVDRAVEQLRIVTEHIQEQLKENEQVRQEIAALERQLAQKPTAQPA